ncbi:MAG: YecA family protein [Salinisphaeraceae bacterium]|jgi:uncharacterized protein YgfB (UPF0149 family)|nr:YecA family protein [Salinisphaeraceae bacterium]
MSSETQYHALQQALEQRGAVQHPSELHGTLCGMLCVHDDIDPAQALDDREELNLDDAMSALREITLEALFDAEAGFTPLLPGDDASIKERVLALGRWCSGFVYGLASQAEFELAGLSDEVQEIIRDLTELGRVGLGEGEAGTEAAESDYAELVEYLRVGVQLIFLELRPARGDTPPRARLH